MKEIILIGGGSHCQNVIDLIINEQNIFKPIGIIDPLQKKKILNIPIIGNDKDLKKLSKTIKYAFPGFGVGKNIDLVKRKIIFEKLIKLNFQIPNLISDKAIIRSNVKLGIGNFIQAGSIIDTGAKLTNNIVIGHNVVIGHGTKINNHVTIGGSVNINGGISIGENSFLGMNSSIYNNVGKFCKISPGTFTSEKIPDNHMVFIDKPKKIKIF